MKRVAVTGVGIVSALGAGTEPTWSRLLRGDSAIGPITAFDPSSFGSRVGAEILDFPLADFGIKPRAARLMTRGDQFAFAAATLALREAGWDLEALGGDRAAVFAGGNKDVSNPDHLRDACLAARNPDGSVDITRFGTIAADSVYPLFYVEGLPGSSLFFISEAYGMTGPNAYFAGTAESGLSAIGAAFRAIRRGEAEVALAGGFEEAITWWNFSKLDTLGILSDLNELGAGASRSYDRGRNGSVLGDGAAFLALEEMSAARRRGADIYAEVTGYGAAFDNRALLSPDPGGAEVAAALRAVLREAGMAAESVDYLASHGSGTLLGDVSETRGIRAAFGAAADNLVASAVKGGTGHLVAGAGALNAAVAALATRHGRVPPTLNLEHIDPDCVLDWTPKTARDLAIANSIALARGIEGQASALALRAI